MIDNEEPTGDFSHLKILLAEDDPLMAKVMGFHLTKMGCPAPVVVGDGAAAMAHLETASEPPHVFITDLNMPGMDGVEMLRHIADRKYRGQIILFSGEHIDVLQTTHALAETHGLNVSAALTKPISYNKLLAALITANKACEKDGDSDRKLEQEAGYDIDPDEIRKGLKNKEFVVQYQPKAHIESSAISGVEALVRWNHPRHGVIGPDHFIGLCERHGLILELTNVVLRDAIAQGGRWAASGTPLTVAINISMDCLERLDYPDFIAGLADEAGLDRSFLMLEITESRLLQDLKNVLEVLTRLRMKGFGLSIDDFGTGYSSMSQLQRLPFTEIKIDRAFVHGVQHDAKARAILETSAELGRRLNMKIVAEGVEEDGDLACITEMGCDVVQGFIVARPMDAEGFDEWLAGWQAQNPVN